MRIHYCVAAAILLAPHFTFAQPATPVVRIQALNRELIRLSGQSRESATNSVRGVLRVRAAAFRELAEDDPDGALTLLLPDTTLAPLRAFTPEIAANLESDGEWSGPAEVVAEDDFEHHSSKTRVSIQAPGLFRLRSRGSAKRGYHSRHGCAHGWLPSFAENHSRKKSGIGWLQQHRGAASRRGHGELPELKYRYHNSEQQFAGRDRQRRRALSHGVLE
jgi:hypothetical protein